MFKFRENTSKTKFANFAKFLKAIYNMFIFQKFEFFRTPTPEPFGESFLENLLIKSRNQNMFEKFKLNWDLQTIPFRIMYNMSMLRHQFSNERCGGGGHHEPP